MKRILWIVAVPFLWVCGPTTGPDDDVGFDGAVLTAPIEFTLRYGEERTIEGTVFRAAFSAVVEDSRCPRDVVCVWQGNAEIVLGLAVGMGPTSAIRLNTTLDPLTAEWSGLTVSLIELTPSPISDQVIPLSAYRVKVRMAPLG